MSIENEAEDLIFLFICAIVRESKSHKYGFNLVSDFVLRASNFRLWRPWERPRFDRRTLKTYWQVSTFDCFEVDKNPSANTLVSKVKAAFAVPSFASALA